MKVVSFSTRRRTKLAGILLLLALLLPASAAFAQSAETELNSAEISFETIEQASFNLGGNESQTVRFNVPPRWQIEQSEGTNRLIVTYDVALSNVVGQEQEIPPTSKLDIFVNNLFVGSLPLEAGNNQTAIIALPSILFEELEQNSYDVQFNLQHGTNCQLHDGSQTAVTIDSLYADDIAVSIHDQSILELTYEVGPLVSTLADFPQPFGDNSLLPVIVPIVITDDADETTVAIAASVAATLGARGGHVAGVEILTVSQAEQGLLDGRDAVLVGLADDHSLIEQYTANADVSRSDTIGLLQIVPSADDQNAYLIVTGQTHEAMQVAARSLSAELNNAMLGLSDSQAYIDQVIEPQGSPFANAEQLPLSQLGYEGRIYSGRGDQLSTITFFVPANWEITENPRLALSYTASGALESASGLTVRLNRQPITSVRATDAINRQHDFIVEIPKEDIRLGEVNRLTFNVANRVEECNIPANDMIWSRILDNGELFLPHQETTIITHNDPIKPLLTSLDLSDVMFALPTQPTTDDLSHLMQTAWIIGRKSGGSAFQPQVVFGNIAESELADSHLVLIGEPDRNPAFTLINDALPQPFDIASNTLLQQVGSVTFELPSDYGIGVVESAAAPWNDQRSVAVISGTSAEGVSWAIDALTNPELSGQFNGNVTFIRGDEISAIDLTSKMSDRSTIVEVNSALAETASDPAPAIEDGEPSLVNSTGTAEAAESSDAAALVAQTDIESLIIGGNYFVPPTAIPTTMRIVAFALLGIALASALFGIYTTWRNQRMAL